MLPALLSALQKIGIIFGIGLIMSAASFLIGVGFALAGNRGLIHLGEYQPWLPLIGLEYGFVVGLVLGVIVWRRKSRQFKGTD
jgi:hypothetical protein